MAVTKRVRRSKIKRRIRKTVVGSTERPRLSVFRSNKEIYAQIIDDDKHVTIASATSLNNKSAAKGSKTEKAQVVGKEIAEKAEQAGVQSVIFDRNGYLYHGRVKSLAESAREGGLKF